MNNVAVNRSAQVPTLPMTANDLLAQRKIMQSRTLNDYVDDIHLALWEDPTYRDLLDAVFDEDAKEGSLAADNILAAMRIREYAEEKNIAYLKPKKLATIVKSLNVVLRRYGIGRNERRSMIDGEIVRGEGRSDSE